jgi:hypothetical protein
MTYARPTIEDYGTLIELTAMMNVGGPEDALQKGVGAGAAPPGHSCPTGPPSAIGPGNGNNGNPPCHTH